MSQYDFSNLESPLSGTTLINTHLEPWRNALHSLHSGSSRPSYATAGMMWLDTTSNPWLLKVFDGSNDIILGRIDTTADTMTLTGDVRASGSGGLSFYNNSGTLIGTLGAGGGIGGTWKGQNNFEGTLQAQGRLSLKDDGLLTIATGAVTVEGATHRIAAESGTADDLATITGGTDGELLLLSADTGDTITLVTSGNIVTQDGESVAFSGNQKVFLQYNSTLSKWQVVAAPSSGGGGVNAIGSIGGGTQDIDLDSGRTVTGTVDTSTTTFTFSNPLSGSDAFDLYLTNGGSQTVNWPASVDWAGGTAPTLTSSGVDHLVFTTPDGGTTWYGYVAGLDMS